MKAEEVDLLNRLARMSSTLTSTVEMSQLDRDAIGWAVKRLTKLETCADALMEHELALSEIPCPGRRGTTMRCMPGDKCSFCRARDLTERVVKVMKGEPTAG